MKLLCIVLYTKDRNYFLCINDYEEVINFKLETLLQQSHKVVLLLKKKLEQQQVATNLASLKEISECCKKIQKSVVSLKILKYLDDKVIKLVTAAVEIMMTSQTVYIFKVY